MCSHGRTHWCHLAGHIGATWQIRLNLCFLQHTWVHSPNGKSIGSAISAQLTAECPCTLQWATLSPKIAPSRGDQDPHLFHDSLNQTKPAIHTASRSVQLFSHRWPQSVPMLYNGHPSPKIAPSNGGSGPHVRHDSLDPSTASLSVQPFLQRGNGRPFVKVIIIRFVVMS